MLAKANLNHLKIAPRKVRLVADLIRGLDVEAAQNHLQLLNKKSAQPLLKLLKSAVTNAENNFKLKKDNLYITELIVNEGPTAKRWMPRAMGRATPIRKRTAHVKLVLAERGQEKIKQLKEAGKKEKEKKTDKNVKVVKSLAEAKKMGKQEKMEHFKEKEQSLKEKESSETAVKEIKDVRREGSGREKQNLDRLRRKSKGGILKRIFRRKTV